MYDIHCHITYDVDDGSQTLDESVKMAEIAYESGVKGIVATPHSNVPRSFKNYWSSELLGKVRELREELVRRNIPLKIFCGQEIFCTRNTVELLKAEKLITINNTRYPLVEFGFYDQSHDVMEILKEIISLGYTPVIAHPERYAFVNENFDAIERIKLSGCLLQVNKGSLFGSFGEEARECASRMLAMRMADVVASDAHSPYMRTTEMNSAHEYICENYSYDYAKYVLNVNPGLILQNSKIYRF